MKYIYEKILLLLNIIYLKYKKNTKFGKNVVIYGDIKKLKIGFNVYLGDNVKIYLKSGNLTLGDNVHVSLGTILVAERAYIELGNFVMIGEYSSIRTCSHGLSRNEIMMKQKKQGSPIIIGNDVWIGRGSVILEDTIIENGVVVGANSVVKKGSKLKSYGIYAGNILRFIKWRE